MLLGIWLKVTLGRRVGEGCCVQEMPYERFQPFCKGEGRKAGVCCRCV